ncbi:TPM domain-containing protein [Spirochaeta thermophila]|uniref:TPM domain-containing protein n=1 Tax=Winmispira thermophila (strain ATCC 49972 / DSM 6192 / RI 19.B1) TaxID=665571 RepID=E0RU67_WINT6|nr:TPM domain-containing protein [Spirochaeta thermophila]ADN02288.1 hypothetical protein STHERM_c13480 [Spirochaeta thermophila DSM 6192]
MVHVLRTTIPIAALSSLLLGFTLPDTPAGRVNDFADILATETEQTLEQLLARYEEATTNQLVVVTVPSLGGESIESYSISLAEKWKIGQKDKDNGVILLVAPRERLVRIEVGYGLEPVLTDATSALIIQRTILPAFREGAYDEGVRLGVEKIIEATTDEETRSRIFSGYTPAEPDAPSLLEDRALWGVVLFLGALFLILFLDQARGSHTVGRRRRRRIPLYWWFGGGSGGGSWGSGGGGFSGGGGGFGGGGASGGW